MRRAAVVAGAILIALATFAPRPVVADEVDVGGQALAITGTHTGLFGDTLHGAVPGALVEVEAHAGRAGIRLETLPVAVTVPAGGRGSFGASNIGLALFNGELTGDVIRGGALRVGIGGQIVDLRNYDGTNGERESARASGVSYVVASDVPVGRGRAIYARLSLIPNVRAQLLRFAGGAAALAPVSESERRRTRRWATSGLRRACATTSASEGSTIRRVTPRADPSSTATSAAASF